MISSGQKQLKEKSDVGRVQSNPSIFRFPAIDSNDSDFEVHSSDFDGLFEWRDASDEEVGDRLGRARSNSNSDGHLEDTSKGRNSKNSERKDSCIQISDTSTISLSDTEGQRASFYVDDQRGNTCRRKRWRYDVGTLSVMRETRRHTIESKTRQQRKSAKEKPDNFENEAIADRFTSSGMLNSKDESASKHLRKRLEESMMLLKARLTQTGG